MRIQYMRELLAIKEQGNFSKAARSLFMTQPALSRHVADMEKVFGVRLLNRDQHKVEFTEAGMKACRSFRKILQAYDNLSQEIMSYKLGMTGQLRLGMLYYTIKQDFGEALSCFTEEYPNVEIKRYSCQPQDVFYALAEERIDIGVLPRADYPDGDFIRYQDLRREGMDVMMSVAHPLAKKEKVSLGDLEDEVSIWLRDDPFTNQSYLEALERCGFVPKHVIETDNIDTVPFAIEESNALYIKAKGFTVAGYEEEIVIRPIAADNLYLVKSYAYRLDNENPLVPLFLKIAKGLG